MAHALISLPSFYLLLLLFIAQFVNWLALLSRADLSFVQPVTALSYITVAVGSYLRFGENVNFTRVTGIAFILLGVFLVSCGGHHASGDDNGPMRIKNKGK